MKPGQFDKAKVRRWRRDVYREFERLGYRGPEIMAAMVMTAIATITTAPDVVSELTGLTPEYVTTVTKRLRKEGIIRGQKVRVAWLQEGFGGALAVALDAGVAAGAFSRFADEKRSAAQRARAPETRARGPRGPRKAVPEGPPTLQKSNPLYGLPEWKKQP